MRDTITHQQRKGEMMNEQDKAACEYKDNQAAQAEPVAWVDEAGFWLSAEYINDLAINSLKDLIRRAKWCSVCDVDLRENGKNVRFEADWIKYMEWRGTHPAPAGTGLWYKAPAVAVNEAEIGKEQYEQAVIDLGQQIIDLCEINQQMITALKMVMDDPQSLEGRPRTFECVTEAIAAAEAAEAAKGGV